MFNFFNVNLLEFLLGQIGSPIDAADISAFNKKLQDKKVAKNLAEKSKTPKEQESTEFPPDG